jgi:transitional endoplasmic reticulum ATPase
LDFFGGIQNDLRKYFNNNEIKNFNIYIAFGDINVKMKKYCFTKSRPIDFGIDYDKLATLTENFVSSDIKDLIVDEASRQALKTHSRITMEILENVIKNTRPSVTLQELKKYEQIKAKMEGDEPGQNNTRNPIGFRR